jgi:hypothetical protein
MNLISVVKAEMIVTVFGRVPVMISIISALYREVIFNPGVIEPDPVKR